MHHGQSKSRFYGGVKRIQKAHARRSGIAKLIDENMKAPIAKTPQQWTAQPNRYDVPNVDTPKRR